MNEEQSPHEEYDFNSTNHPAFIQLRQQIEFYFSESNLLTDRHMLEHIQKSERSWLPIEYFLQCRKVREILRVMKVGFRGRKRRITKAIRSSAMLKIWDNKVKRRDSFKLKRSMRKMVYIEADTQPRIQAAVQAIEDFCREHSIGINKKVMEGWAIFVANTKEQGKQLERYIRIKGGDLGLERVLGEEEWYSQQQKLESIRKRLREQTAKKQSVLTLLREGKVGDMQ